MALTNVEKVVETRFRGSTEWRIFSTTIGTYSTGGLALTAANCRLSTILFLNAHSSGGYVFEYDYANSKLLAYYQKDPADTGGSNIALTQVSDNANLGAIVTRFIVYGHA